MYYVLKSNIISYVSDHSRDAYSACIYSNIWLLGLDVTRHGPDMDHAYPISVDPAHAFLNTPIPAKIGQPNALANGSGKSIQYVYSRDDAFCERIFSILGLIESWDLVSQDGKDSLGRIAVLEVGKERV